MDNTSSLKGVWSGHVKVQAGWLQMTLKRAWSGSRPVFLNFAPIMSLESMKLGTSNAVCWLIQMCTSAGMIDYHRKGCFQGHATSIWCVWRCVCSELHLMFPSSCTHPAQLNRVKVNSSHMVPKSRKGDCPGADLEIDPAAVRVCLNAQNCIYFRQNFSVRV